MNGQRRLRADIAVVGLGLVGVHQVTTQVEETIRRCNRTFVIDTAFGVVDYLRTLCPEVTVLASPHDAGTHRILIYRRMATEVVSAALDDAPVCFATYGHPRMYCYPTTLISRAAQVLDLSVEVMPGISFLDTLLVSLGVDPGFDGLQLYEATDLVVRARPVLPDVNCVIAQGPITLDAYNRADTPSAESLNLLQEHLLEFYPAEHEAVLVVSGTHPLLQDLKQAVPIGRLAEALRVSPTVTTIFIPPVTHRPVASEALAARMTVPGSDGEPAGAGVPHRPGRPPIGPQPGD